MARGSACWQCWRCRVRAMLLGSGTLERSFGPAGIRQSRPMFSGARPQHMSRWPLRLAGHGGVVGLPLGIALPPRAGCAPVVLNVLNAHADHPLDRAVRPADRAARLGGGQRPWRGADRHFGDRRGAGDGGAVRLFAAAGGRQHRGRTRGRAGRRQRCGARHGDDRLAAAGVGAVPPGLPGDPDRHPDRPGAEYRARDDCGADRRRRVRGVRVPGGRADGDGSRAAWRRADRRAGLRGSRRS